MVRIKHLVDETLTLTAVVNLLISQRVSEFSKSINELLKNPVKSMELTRTKHNIDQTDGYARRNVFFLQIRSVFYALYRIVVKNDICYNRPPF